MGGRATHLVISWLMFSFLGTFLAAHAPECISQSCTYDAQKSSHGAHEWRTRNARHYP